MKKLLLSWPLAVSREVYSKVVDGKKERAYPLI